MSYIINRDTKVYVSTVNEGFNSTNTRMFRALRGIEFNVPSGITNHRRSSMSTKQTRNTTPYTQTIGRVTFSIPIYYRPYRSAGLVDCVERYFWESFAGSLDAVEDSASDFRIVFDQSRVVQLPEVQIFLQYDNKMYKFENAAVGSFATDLDIRQISRTVVRGTASHLVEVDIADSPAADTVTNLPGLDLEDVSINRYSVLQLQHEGSNYDLPITGGSLRLDNNISVNSRPKVGSPTMHGAYYTGALTAEGFLRCYLKNGTNRSSDFLLQRLLDIRGEEFQEVFSNCNIILGGNQDTSIEYVLGETLFNIPNFSNTNVVSLTFQFMVKDTENMQIIYRTE